MLGQCFPKHLSSNSDPVGCFLGTGTIVKRSNLFQNISNEYPPVWLSCPFPLFSLAFSKLTWLQTAHLSTTHTFYTSVIIMSLPWWLSRWRIFLKCRRHRRHGFNPWVRKIPWRRKMATHSSILAWKINPMDKEAWWDTVQRVAKSPTQLSN